MKTEKQHLVDALKMYHDSKFTPGVYEHSIIGKAALMLENSEEVVRCKDCKHWRRNYIAGRPSGVCIAGKARRTSPDDFCSYGERRTE